MAEDQDWYRFNDQTIYTYLGEIRRMWETIGVREPEVLFTLAESYNAPENGVLPNYVYRNMPGVTGLLTVNLYPKTAETADHALLNSPFKADLDVKSATEAGNAYLGGVRQEWAMGPEIQGGWWAGVPVSEASRQQTYLSVLGHGLKSFFVYYFHEGQNWGIEWAYQRIKPIFTQLRVERGLENVPVRQLSNEFWGELQARADRLLVMGFDARRLMENDGPTNTENLYFDAPLDPQANPRGHYSHLRRLGERVIAPYADFLARAVDAVDAVALVKDSASHVPGADPAINSGRAASDWSGALLAYTMNADVNPRILLGELSPEANFQEAKILLHLDTGINAPRTLRMLRRAVNRGQTVVNFLAEDVARASGIPVPRATQEFGQSFPAAQTLIFYLKPDGRLGTENEPGARAVSLTTRGPIFTYDLSGRKNCQGILFWEGRIAGYRCEGKGSIVQVGAIFFEEYNSSGYPEIQNPRDRSLFLQALLAEAEVEPQLRLSEKATHTVAFARKDPDRKLLWITVKTGSRGAQTLKLRIRSGLLRESISTKASKFRITDLLKDGAERSQILTRARLTREGFPVDLEAEGSRVYVIEGEN